MRFKALHHAKPVSIGAWIAFCALGWGSVLAPEPLAAGETAPNLQALRQHALELVNAARRQNDLPALSLGEDLNEAATYHAQDMLERHYYAHTSPEGDTVRDRFRDAGGSRWQLVAENIARCEECRPPRSLQEVEDLQEGWMNSPPHRANILHAGLQRFGYSLVVSSQDGLYAVQTFAGPGTPRSLQSGETAEAVNADEQAREALRFVNRARSRHGLAELKLSDALTEAAKAMVPTLADMPGQPDDDAGPLDRLPADTRRNWLRIAYLSAECGGC